MTLPEGFLVPRPDAPGPEFVVEEPVSPYQLVLCTCPDRVTGESLARALVTARVAACVNVLDGVTSVYEWKGKILEDREVLLLIKSRRDRFDALRTEIVRLHPYELPEIIAVAVQNGLAPYLRWIDACLISSR